mgnify:CR=1
MAKVVTFGEPMVLFTAQESGPLKDARTFKKSLAGAELNVCIGLKRLGHTPLYITKLGKNDPFGAYIYDSMRDRNFDLSGISFADKHLTGFMLKNKSREPETAYFRKDSAASHITPKDIDNIPFDEISHVHITGIPCALSESCLAATFRLIERAKENKVYLSFDPNLRPSLWPDKATMAETLNRIACQSDMVMPGISEGKTLTGFCKPEEIADYYLSKGVKDVAVKIGPKGAYVKSATVDAYLPCFDSGKIVDRVGAGDGFAVGVISGRLEGLSLKDAVMRGNIIGALQTTVEGDNEGLPTREILEKCESSIKKC